MAPGVAWIPSKARAGLPGRKCSMANTINVTTRTTTTAWARTPHKELGHIALTNSR